MEHLGMKKMAKKKKLRQRLLISSNPITLICVIFSIFCLLMLAVIASFLRIPDNASAIHSVETRHLHNKNGNGLGTLGKMMLDMLPDDLAFTVFVPLETAFKRDLGLQMIESSTAEERENTYAVLSRVLGFSAVPRRIHSDSVPVDSEVSFDSVSGFRLNIYRGSDGPLYVNRVRSVSVNLVKGETVVHMMDGVMMDAEFEQSVRPDDDDVEDN